MTSATQDVTTTSGPATQSFVLLVGIRGEEVEFPNPDVTLIEEKLRSLDWTIEHNRIVLKRSKGRDLDNMFIESRDGQLYAMRLGILWTGNENESITRQSKTFSEIGTAVQILNSHLNGDGEFESLVEWE